LKYFIISPHNGNILTLKDNVEFKYDITFIPISKKLSINLKGKSLIAPRLQNGVLWEIPLDNVENSVDTMIHWASQNPTELNLLRKLLVDLIAIVENWCAIKDYAADLLYIALLFLKAHHHLHPDFPETRNNIVKKFHEFSKTENTYSLTAAQFNRELFSDDENQPWFDKDETSVKREDLAQKTVESLFKYTFAQNQCERKEQKIIVQNELEQSKAWFLSRYDLKQACEIATHTFRVRQIIKPVFLFAPEAIASFIFLSSLIFFLSGVGNINDYFSIIPLIDIITPSYSRLLLCLYLCLFTLPFILFLQSKSKDPDITENLQLLLPRLIAGIMAGYLLLMSDEVWRFVFDFPVKWEIFQTNRACFPGWIIIVRCFLPLVGVYIYIFIEISHVKGIIKATQKSRLFFSRAYSYAIIMGLMVSDIFGDSMMSNTAENVWSKSAIPGFIGHIYPQVLIFLAPLALFVGIVLQLLWDDKKLTDKI